MSQFAMITTQGVNKINEAHADGEHIEIAFYVPVYDYKIDPNLGVTDSSISATNIMTVTNSADVVPQGEILWNTPQLDAYALSLSDKYLAVANETTATSGSGIVVTNFAHRNGLVVNTYNNSAIGEYYTATNVLSPGNSGTYWFFSNTGFEVTNPPTSANGYGPLSLDKPTTDVLYRGVTYQPVFTSAGDDSRANFKVTVRCPVGQIKFNKIGLYAVKRLGDDTLTGEPFLFAQVIIPQPQILYSNSVGSNSFSLGELTLDFQIETHTVSADFENVFFSTSGDYWVRTTNESDGNYGLSYDGTVYIANRLAVDDKGNFLNTSADRAVSKLFVSTYDKINAATSDREKDIPQLCMQRVTANGQNRIRTTFTNNLSGDCEVDLYGACTSGHYDPFSLIPATDKDFGLGIHSRRWSHGYFSNKLEMYTDDLEEINTKDFDGYYVKLNALNDRSSFYNSDVYCGPYYSSASTDKRENSNYFYGNISSYRGYYPDGTIAQNYDLLVRSLNDVVITTFKQAEADESWATAEQIIEEIWNMKDGKSPNISDNLGADKDILLVAGRNIYTYGDVIPLVSRKNKIGDYDNTFVDVFTQKITGEKISENSPRHIVVESNLVPFNMDCNIRANENTGHRWNKIDAVTIGDSETWVSIGFFQTIFANNIKVSKDGSINIDGVVNISQNGIIPNTSNLNIGSVGLPINNIYVNKLYANDIILAGTLSFDSVTDKSIKTSVDEYYSFEGTFQVNDPNYEKISIPNGDDFCWVLADGSFLIELDMQTSQIGSNDKHNRYIQVDFGNGYETINQDLDDQWSGNTKSFGSSILNYAKTNKKDMIVVGTSRTYVKIKKIRVFINNSTNWGSGDRWSASSSFKYTYTKAVEQSGKNTSFGTKEQPLGELWVEKINGVVV